MTFESYSNDVEVMKGRLLGWLDELFVNLEPVKAEASEENGTVVLKIPAGRLTIHILVVLVEDGTWSLFGSLTDDQGRGRDCTEFGDISCVDLACVLINSYQKAFECGAEEKK